ncbi:MAG: hypothetical protein IJP34_03205 [Clostridia bacterium]|nr:hypothetical protein [Clostridia bacterium]
MKKFQKILAAILSLVFIVSAFAGCTEKHKESKLSTLTHDKLPQYEGDGFILYELVENDKYVQIINGEAKEFDVYYQTLIDAGFMEHASNQIGENKFATLKNQNTIATLSYRPFYNEIKVVSEKRNALYPREKDNKYKSKDMQSLFTGIKGENVLSYSGMGIVIRLDDGSFIIIDGGGGDKDSVDSNKLLNILKEQSPKDTEKPVIAAWIFTHPHSDHIGMFNYFSDDFHDKVIIENFYYNFPESNRGYGHFEECMKNYYSEVGTIIPHTGDRYYIRNAVVEVLFTLEDLYPNTYKDGKISDVNQSSLIFRIEIEGQTIMITGDVHTMGQERACNCFGDYLKSDILQMAHHGQNGTVEFYSTVDPTYAVLPVSYSAYETHYTFNSANNWLIKSKNVRQFLDFAKYNVTFGLPYNPSDKEIQKRVPDWTTEMPTYPTLKPKTVKAAKSVPEAWFDLGFKDGKAYDKLGNLTVSMPAGTIGETTVKYNDKDYKLTAFNGDADNEGLLVNLPFKTADEYKNWLMNGSTLELFLQINKGADFEDDVSSKLGATLFGNLNVGGASLCYRDYGERGQLQLLMGATAINAATNPWQNLVCAARRWPNEGPTFMSDGSLIHLVATYDKKSNQMRVYMNGILSSSASFGNGEFNIGNAGFDVLGIGINPSNPEENFGKTGNFTVVGAKLYKTALNESQVLAEYNNCIKAIKK